MKRKTKASVTNEAETKSKHPKKNAFDALKGDSSNKKFKFDSIPPREDGDGLKIVSWNVNGMRALMKDAEYVKAYIAREDPEIICFGETKLGSADSPSISSMFPQYPTKRWSYAEKKGYSGIAVFSKIKPLKVETVLRVGGNKHDGEGRYLAFEFENFWFVYTYVPNAGMKLERLDYRTKEWDCDLLQTLKELEKEKPVVLGGDLNVAHGDIDVHNPKTNRNKTPGFTDAERNNFSNVLSSGFIDTFRKQNADLQQFTYWSRRFNCKAQNKGWRLDYFVVSECLEPKMGEAFVRADITGSDHCPIGIFIKMETDS